MNYELLEKLKNAGFEQHGQGNLMLKNYSLSTKVIDTDEGYVIVPEQDNLEMSYCPTLEELITACGSKINRITQNEMSNDSLIWTVVNWDDNYLSEGKTPAEAVANFWLKIQAVEN